ncbi:MAG: esterase/lipase family protein [Rubripirellula sp.]
MLTSSGCCCLGTTIKWYPPVYATPRKVAFCESLAEAESLYASAVCLEAKCSAECVDLYYQVAQLTSQQELSPCDGNARASQLHKSSLRKIVEAGQRFGRLDPAIGLTLHEGGHERVVPIRKRGFPWKAEDFQRLEPVGKYKTNEFRKAYYCPGVGVPMVVVRKGCENGFLPPQAAFNATLVMRPKAGCATCSQDAADNGGELELIDSLRIRKIHVAERAYKIAWDISASIAYQVSTGDRNYFSAFIDPASSQGEGKLHTMEPYQAGKIPIVFVHGLLSDPYTWAQMVNELRAQPGFIENYQVWVYQYPTGRPFVSSAAKLRSELRAAHQQFDPMGYDPQLSNMVMVGHSLGGLITKLQVTCSGDALWGAVAKCPLDSIRVGEQTREELRSFFYFKPSPDIKRVVYMGTPHLGSAYARRCVGRLSSALITMPDEDQAQHEEMITCNPGVFSREVSRRIPTSIDLMDPKSPLLNEIAKLPVSPNLHMHSVIGNYCWRIGFGHSDLVVPVESAKEPRAETELTIRSRHSDVNKHPKAVAELICILREHLAATHPKVIQPLCLQTADFSEASPSVTTAH